MNNVRHVLGISGGKDSAALAIYLKRLYPKLPIEIITPILVVSCPKQRNLSIIWSLC